MQLPHVVLNCLTYLHAFLKLCSDNIIIPVPISSANLGRYIAHLSLKLSFSSSRNYRQVVRILHLEVGNPNPLDSYYISSTLKGPGVCQGKSPNPSYLLQLTYLSKCSLVLTCLYRITFFGTLSSNIFISFQKVKSFSSIMGSL